jgi:hypothetical protein
MAFDSIPDGREEQPSPKQLLESKLLSSGIPLLIATKAGIKVTPPARLAEMRSAGGVAMTIPYYDIKGKPTGFERYRWLRNPPATGFSKQAKDPKKPERYWQEAGTGVHAYFPPNAGTDWAATAQDESESLIITEGELKALSASFCGYAAIGLGGVSSWRCADTASGLLKSIDSFKLFGRKVFIIFDSDMRLNPTVKAECARLSAAFVRAGAVPYVVELLSDEEGNKQGLDDFLLNSGPDALRELLVETEQKGGDAAARALHAMNDEWAVLRSSSEVLNTVTGHIYSISKFKDGIGANLQHYVSKSPKTGPPALVRAPTAPAWLDWHGRAELEAVGFLPGCAERVYEKDGRFYYNLWKGWPVQPIKGDMKPYHDFVDCTFGEDTSARLWLEQWAAMPFQFPGTKVHTAVLLWSHTQGNGKTELGKTYGFLHGKGGSTISGFGQITETELADERMDWAKHKTFVLVDDISKHDGRRSTHHDSLKALITGDTIRINQKYVAEYTVNNYLSLWFTSNYGDALYIPKTDRRVYVYEVTSPIVPKDIMERFLHWRANGGLSHLLHYLLHLPLEGRKPTDHAPMTAAKMDMVESSRGAVAEFFAYFKENPEQVMRKIGKDVDIVSSRYLADAFAIHYETTFRHGISPNVVARELKAAGFIQPWGHVPLQTSAGGVRPFLVQNKDADWITVCKKAGSQAKAVAYLNEHFRETFRTTRKGPKF